MAQHKRLIIAIDGPAGAGKSTVAREVARRLGYLFINTGAMYRALAWKALQEGIALEDKQSLGDLARRAIIELSGPVDALEVTIDGQAVTSAIVTPEISRAASIVSAVPAVRRALVAQQQALGAVGGVVMEGRDIGTHVFPTADLKIFLDATAEARAQRRWMEEESRGRTSLPLLQIQAEIEERDARDRTREDSPLVRAADALYLDSSALSIETVVAIILGHLPQEPDTAEIEQG
jgi:cytidylate kinase